MKKSLLHIAVMMTVLLATVAGAEESRTHKFQNRDGEITAMEHGGTKLDEDHTVGFEMGTRELAVSSQFGGFGLSLLFSAGVGTTIQELQDAGKLTEDMGRLAFPLAAALLERQGTLSADKAGAEAQVSVNRDEVLTIARSEDLSISMLLTPHAAEGPALLPISPVGALGGTKVESCSGACDCDLCVCGGSLGCCLDGCDACWEVIDDLKGMM